MFKKCYDNLWLYPTLKVNDASNIHELLNRKPFVKLSYQPFDNFSALRFNILKCCCPFLLSHLSSALASPMQHVKVLVKKQHNKVHF